MNKVVKQARPRNEGVQLRPFVGLDAIDEIFTTSTVIVSHDRGEYPAFFGGRIKVPHKLLGGLGYRIAFGSSIPAIAKAVTAAGIPTEKVDLIVLARDPGLSPLKETVVLKRTALDGIEDECSLILRGDKKHRVMLNKHDGFDLEFQLVLNDALPYKALRPRLKGTILTRATVAVLTTDVASGLQPNKLTNAIRQENELAKDSWLWTNEIDSLVNSNSLSECLAPYVDDETLRLISLLPEDVRVLAEHLFTVPILVQVIMSASKELQQDDLLDFVFDGRNSAVLNLIYQKVKKSEGGDMPLGRFTDLLRTDAPRIVSSATADQGTRKALRKALNNLIGDEDDLSED